jgi:hypothetical protein
MLEFLLSKSPYSGDANKWSTDITQPESVSLFPIDTRPYGLTYGEWSARWWQWLLSIPRSSSPAFDATGYNANVNQDDSNVFFLCQTVDSIQEGGAVQHRTIFMRARRSVFMPIINWVSILDVDGQTDEELSSVAKKRMDVVSELDVKINGISIKQGLNRYRAISPFFTMMLPEDNIFNLSPGFRGFVADGYWIFLKPTEKDIKLTTYGSCSSGLNKFGINYHIITI